MKPLLLILGAVVLAIAGCVAWFMMSGRASKMRVVVQQMREGAARPGATEVRNAFSECALAFVLPTGDFWKDSPELQAVFPDLGELPGTLVLCAVRKHVTPPSAGAVADVYAQTAGGTAPFVVVVMRRRIGQKVFEADVFEPAASDESTPTTEASRKALITRLHELGLSDDPSAPRPVVSLEAFFEENHDEGSIYCNATDHPGTQTIFRILRDIRDRDDVQDVLVEVSEVLDGEGEWPFSERVYVLTRASNEDVRSWLSDLEPDEVSEGWTSQDVPPGAPTVGPGVRVVGVWWD